MVWWAARRWGRFGIDLAANVESRVVPLFLGPGSNQEDALAEDWKRIAENLDKLAVPPHAWCNPPYSQTDEWLGRAMGAKHHGLSSTFLIPAKPGDRRYGSIASWASEVLFIVGRLAFIGPTGEPVSGNFDGSALVHFRAYDELPPRIGFVRREVMSGDYHLAMNGEPEVSA